jgi:hypothetical protein
LKIILFNKNISIYIYYFKNYEGIPASQIHHHRFRDGRINRENYNEGEQDEYEHVKRKSDYLLSLYGLPYNLIGQQ